MEEIKLWGEILQRYGWTGLLTLYLFWDRILRPQWKKRTGEFVHWKDLKKKLDEDNDEIKQIKRIMNSQIEKEIIKDARMRSLELTQNTIEKNVEDMKFLFKESHGQNKTIMRLMGEVKDTLEAIKDK